MQHDANRYSQIFFKLLNKINESPITHPKLTLIKHVIGNSSVISIPYKSIIFILVKMGEMRMRCNLDFTLIL